MTASFQYSHRDAILYALSSEFFLAACDWTYLLLVVVVAAAAVDG